MAGSKMALFHLTTGTTHSYEIDTGTGYGLPVPIGYQSTYSGITIPPCQSVRITSVLTSSQVVDRVHLAAVSKTAGLTFTFGGVSNSDFVPAMQLARRRRHYTLVTSSLSSNTFVMEITGVGGAPLDIGHYGLYTKGWEPFRNYNFGSGTKDATTYTQNDTYSRSHQRASDRKRSWNLTLSEEPEEVIEALDHLLDTKTRESGFLLVERDQDSPLKERNSFAVNVQPGGNSNPSFGNHNTTLTLKEAFSENG